MLENTIVVDHLDWVLTATECLPIALEIMHKGYVVTTKTGYIEATLIARELEKDANLSGKAVYIYGHTPEKYTFILEDKEPTP